MSVVAQQGLDYVGAQLKRHCTSLAEMSKQERVHLAALGDGFGTREIAERLRSLALDRLPRVGRALDEPFMLMIVGEGKAGKSTLINGLFGEDIVPTGLAPETKDIIYLKYGAVDYQVLHWKGGETREFDDLAAMWKFVRALPESGPSRSHNKVDYLEIHRDRELLRSLSIVDTPGMNAIFTEHETRTRAFLQDANACLWVFNAIGTGGGSFTEQALAEIKRYKRRVIAVLNRIDALPTEDDRAKVRKYVRDHFSPYFDNELIDYAARDVYDARMAGNEQAAAFQEYYLPLALYLRTQFFDAGEGLAKEKAATSLDAVIHLLGELGQEYKTYAPAIEEEVQAALDLTGLQDQARSELNHQADGIDANLAAFIDERCEILRKRVEDILLTFIDAEVRLRLDFKKMKDKAYIEGKINEEYGLEELIKSSIERTMNRLKNLLEREWEDAIPTVVEKLGGDRAKLGPIQSAMQEAMVNVLMDIAMKLGGLAALFAVLWIIPGGQIVDAVIMAVVATLQVFTQGRFIDSIIEKKKKKARTGVVRIAMSQCEAIRDKLTIEAENWNRECLDGVLEAVAEERDEAQQRKDELTKLKRMRVQHVKRVRSYANVYEDHKDDLNG